MRRANERRAFLAVALLYAASASGCGGEEKPAAPTQAPPAKPEPASPKVPLVAPPKAADWCGEHGVPESACTRCNADLVPEFKKKGDWCDKHGLPESQCVTCDPAVAEKLKALAPAGK
ncbi:MAG: hypothetical protein HUU06_00225 [Planctomycetaceae bacterium]|nr:hypothetical protein [Planctomycetota bacterium]NUN51201.1 hypothetical protein [Planctomycetaceae bacterium]